MKAILIDAVEKTVSEVNYENTLEHAYRLLRCDLVDVVHVDDDVMFVDDEGLLAGSPTTLRSSYSATAGRSLDRGSSSETLTKRARRHHALSTPMQFATVLCSRLAKNCGIGTESIRSRGSDL